MLRLFGWKKQEGDVDAAEEQQPDAAGLYGVAYELSLRGLSQQEGSLNELRTRTGTLLAASSLAASFLGARAAIETRFAWATVLGLAAFILSVGQCTYILLPRKGLIFSLRGTALIEDTGVFGEPLAEIHRRLAYWLDGYHRDNQEIIDKMFPAFRWAAGAVLAEVVIWTAQLLAQ